ncbi:MAG: ABC transporter permease [Deltaproteobacteria bacterium]|nr:ABC transporter permease [Deltaproteobacteria bacterium]
MSRWQVFTRGARRYPGAYAGGLLVAIVCVAALLAPWLSPFSPEAMDLPAELTGPTGTHPLGTGDNGVDVLTHVLHGARVSLYVALFTTLISVLLGVLAGLYAGYFGGWVDEVLMRIVDILLAFPGILLAIFITAVLGPAIEHLVLALALTGWVGYARLARAQVLALREREFVLAARALGARTPRIFLKHLVPNIAGPIIVQATFGLPGVILAEVALSFLGLGVPPGTPSWGALLEAGAQYLLVAPHLATAPGIAVVITVLGFNFLGDGLRDRLDPRSH